MGCWRFDSRLTTCQPQSPEPLIPRYPCGSGCLERGPEGSCQAPFQGSLSLFWVPWQFSWKQALPCGISQSATIIKCSGVGRAPSGCWFGNPRWLDLSVIMWPVDVDARGATLWWINFTTRWQYKLLYKCFSPEKEIWWPCWKFTAVVLIQHVSIYGVSNEHLCCIYRYRWFEFPISVNHFPISVNYHIFRYRKFELPEIWISDIGKSNFPCRKIILIYRYRIIRFTDIGNSNFQYQTIILIFRYR